MGIIKIRKFIINSYFSINELLTLYLDSLEQQISNEDTAQAAKPLPSLEYLI